MTKKQAEKRIGTILLLIIFTSLIGFYTLLTLQIHQNGREVFADPERVTQYILVLLKNTTLENILIAVMTAVVFSTAFILFYLGNTKLFRYIHRYRYPIAVIIILLITILEINNTSLYQWTEYVGLKGAEQYAPFWGVSRGIRADEWSVWSPLALSQQPAGYPAVSQTIAGGDTTTVWISMGGIPAYSLAAVFKPFYWGFLTLGASRGYSLLFALRIVLLFLASLELAQHYTGKNLPLSYAAAAMITLSPYVQWWFSQSIAEVLIFGQAMVLCFIRLIKENRNPKKHLWAILFAWLLGCYVMIGYPAWTVSAAYLIIPACILIARQNRTHLRNLFRLIIPTVISLVILGIIVYQSKDTLLNVLNSEYPGHRLITGGGLAEKQLVDDYSIFQPFVKPILSNESESAAWITFAPAGIILTILNMVRNKKPDALSVILLSMEFLFILFAAIGFPAWLAKITLFSQFNRPELTIGICDTILLFRGLSRRKQLLEPQSILLLSVSIIIFHFCYLSAKQTMDAALMSAYICISLFVLLTIFSTTAPNKHSIRFASCTLIILAILGGGFVNPLQRGIESITQINILDEIQPIGNEDNLWFVEGGYPVTNLPLVAGKKTLNSTQPYPDPSKWKAIDKQNRYEEIYNRFANMSSGLIKEETMFSLIAGDHVYLQLNEDDLKTLNVKYVLTGIDHSDRTDLFQLIKETDDFKVYQIIYPETGR